MNNSGDSIRFRWVESLRFPSIASCGDLPVPSGNLTANVYLTKARSRR